MARIARWQVRLADPTVRVNLDGDWQGTVETAQIQDGSGCTQVVWMPRAGDTLCIADHPSDRNLLITEATYRHDEQTLLMKVHGI